MSDRSHQIATAAIQQIIRESVASGLNWTDTLICLETMLVIGICYLARTEAAKGTEERWSQEMLDSLTEAASKLIIDGLRKVI